jgi:hypothetical protein
VIGSRSIRLQYILRKFLSLSVVAVSFLSLMPQCSGIEMLSSEGKEKLCSVFDKLQIYVQDKSWVSLEYFIDELDTLIGTEIRVIEGEPICGGRGDIVRSMNGPNIIVLERNIGPAHVVVGVDRFTRIVSASIIGGS